MTPEFSHPVRLDHIGAGDTDIAISAGAEERAALARRFGLLSLDRLDARFRLRRDAAGVIAVGEVTGDAVQPCIASAEPVPAAIRESVQLRFVPEGTAEGDEIELDDQSADTVFYAGGAIDLGEAAAETLALALPPYPRSPHADTVLRDAGVLREEEAGPFSKLAALKDRL